MDKETLRGRCYVCKAEFTITIKPTTLEGGLQQYIATLISWGWYAIHRQTSIRFYCPNCIFWFSIELEKEEK